MLALDVLTKLNMITLWVTRSYWWLASFGPYRFICTFGYNIGLETVCVCNHAQAEAVQLRRKQQSWWVIHGTDICHQQKNPFSEYICITSSPWLQLATVSVYITLAMYHTKPNGVFTDSLLVPGPGTPGANAIRRHSFQFGKRQALFPTTCSRP